MNGLWTAAPWAILSQFHRPTYIDPNFTMIRSEARWEPLLEEKKKKKKKHSRAEIREPEPESGSYCCHSCLRTSRKLMCDTRSLSQPTAAAFSTTTFPYPHSCFLAGASKNKQSAFCLTSAFQVSPAYISLVKPICPQNASCKRIQEIFTFYLYRLWRKMEWKLAS